jgi:hypothetical protein
VHVDRAHDAVEGLLVRDALPRDHDAVHRAAFDEDPVHARPRVQLGTGGARPPGEGVDDRGEAAQGIQHAVLEIERAHEMEQRGSDRRCSAEEDRRVLQDLPQPSVGERGLDHALQRSAEQRSQTRELAEISAGREGARVREVGVEEAIVRDARGPRRGVEVPGECGARTGLDRFEQRESALARGMHVEGVSVVGEDPVGRIEADEVELGGGARAEESEAVIEHLGHQVPRRPRIEAESLALPAPRPSTEPFRLLEQGHLVPVRGEQGGRGQSGDTASEHGDAAHRASSLRRTARTSSVALRHAGTRIRCETSARAGVRRSRAERSA